MINFYIFALGPFPMFLKSLNAQQIALYGEQVEMCAFLLSQGVDAEEENLSLV